MILKGPLYLRPARDSVGRGALGVIGNPWNWAYSLSMLQLARPAGSLLVFLAVLVAIGAAFGHVIDMAGVALFLLFVSSISAKPAWKFWFDPPARRESGRASCAINSYQRVGATSPKEIRQLPEHRFSKRARRS